MTVHPDLAQTIAARAIEKARQASVSHTGQAPFTTLRLAGWIGGGVIAAALLACFSSLLWSASSGWRMEHACPTLCTAHEAEFAKLIVEMNAITKQIQKNTDAVMRSAAPALERSSGRQHKT